VDMSEFTESTPTTTGTLSQIKIQHLSDYLPNLPRIHNKMVRSKAGHKAQSHYNQEIGDDQLVILDLVRKQRDSSATGMLRAGPRRYITWQPGEVKAAIVTAGGLCPGLNSVVCELVNMLYATIHQKAAPPPPPSLPARI
jgi:hypothetical protein